MAKGDDILDRLIQFGVAALSFSNALPKTVAARHIADQLMRSATSGAPNYAEARTGESIRDFVHKLGIVRKELNESYVWLRILEKSGIGDNIELAALIKECDELCRIISASKKTAEQRTQRERFGLD
ncbi:MAG: four helix bundle protein [Bacteroidota bacterium]